MPHFPKPFFRESRGVWYVQIAGKQFNLGPDREAAFQRYHELMRQTEGEVPVEADYEVAAIFEEFLEWTQKNRSPASYDWYRDHLTSFARSLPRNVTTKSLRPFHLQKHLDSKTTWSSGSKRGAVIAIKRSFNWAEKMGYINRNPLRHFERPPGGRREQIVTVETHGQILAITADDAFRDLLTAAWHTGARPQELLRVEARHVDLKNARWVFPKEEAKGKRHIRVVYLNDIMVDMTRRLMLKHPDGPLFRNTNGRPWQGCSVNCRFLTIRTVMGKRIMRDRGIDVDETAVAAFAKKLRPERRVAGRLVPKTRSELLMEARDKCRRRMASQYAPKFCLYNWRHSFATRMLEAGVDAMIVATLMGHVDTTMLGKVYSHVSQNAGFLREVLRKNAG